MSGLVSTFTRKRGSAHQRNVALGLIPGEYPVFKFGRTSNADNGVDTDIWSGANVAPAPASPTWVAPTQARVHALVSTDGGDTMNVTVWGLTDWDTAETSEVVTLDGTNPVNTSSSYVIIHRMQASSANAGHVTATAATDGTVTAHLEPGAARTQMAIYGVPSTQTLIITDVGASMHKATNVDMDLIFRIAPDPETDETFFIDFVEGGFAQSGTSFLVWSPFIPLTISGPTIIKMTANADTNDTRVSGFFGGKLVDNA